MKQSREIAIDWLLPALLTWTKESADTCCMNSIIKSTGKQRKHAAFAVSEDTDRLHCCIPGKPIDDAQCHLHFVTGQSSPQLKRCTMQVFSVRHVSTSKSFFAMTTDERRNNHATAGFCKMPGHLRLCGNSICKAANLFRSLIGIRQHDHIRNSFSFGRQQQSFAVDRRQPGSLR